MKKQETEVMSEKEEKAGKYTTTVGIR